MNTNNTHTHPLTAAVDSIANVIDEALVIAVEAESSDALLARLAEARAGIVRVDVIMHVIDVPGDQPRVYADELPATHELDVTTGQQRELPKLKPLPKGKGAPKVRYKPGIGALLRKPIEYDCPACGAEKGTFCFQFEGPGAHPKVTTKRNNGHFFHTRRSDLSTAENKRIRKANVMP